jgi:NAD(P)-dependent dehydrogenase (short-subunit alcohol dehydrogenase family)
MKNMPEKTLKILITGGTRGLGRKIAESLSRKGHEVYVFSKTIRTGIDQSFLSTLAGYTECDLSKAGEIEDCFRKLTDQTKRIDVLINNAAVRQFNTVGNFNINEIQQNINVDLTAPVILSNLCLPVMKRNNFGRIINISSISAYKVFATGSIYCSSKSALNTFSESLGKEINGLNSTVTVNTICPGSFSKMDGTPLKNYQRITNGILADIDLILGSDSKGKVYNEFTFMHRVRESLRLIKRALQVLIS